MSSARRPRRLSERDGYAALFRHFKIVRTLGRGNFAVCYHVRRLSDGEDYAMKHIDLEAMDPSEYADLVNEIRLMAAADHPNLLTFYEAFVDRNQLFVVTELAPGGDLGALLGKLDRRREGLPETEVWRYFLQLAAGLQYLHHSRVLHRDVKPENVLIGEGGLLKIADFGISQVLDHVFTRVLMGTPQYVAPEAWRGQPYSYSADVWALGCILHELCTRRPLFLPRGRPSDAEIRGRVLEGKVTPISRKYSRELWQLIRWLLVQNPAARPTMDEIMDMEMVQARRHLLPREVRDHLESHQRSEAILPGLFKITADAETWPQLNAVLPPAKYRSGPGVAEALRLPRPSSCPDLAAAGEGEGEAAAQPAQHTQQAGQAQAGQPSLFHFSEAYPASPKGGLRRASMSVPAWQAAAAAAQAPGSRLAGLMEEQQQQGGSSGEGQAAAVLRRRSMSDALRSKPRPITAAFNGLEGAQLGRFDPSPLQFGSPRSRAPGSSSRSGSRPAPARPPLLGGSAPAGGGSDFDDASYYGGGDGTSTWGGGSYYEASYHGSYVGGGGSYAGSYGGSYHGGAAGAGAFYDSSVAGGSMHGGSYYEPSVRGGFGAARAARDRRPPPPKPAGGSGGGFLSRLFSCFGG